MMSVGLLSNTYFA